MMRRYHEQLQVHALKDLSNRAKSGMFMYLLVWLVLLIIYEINDTHPLFFYLTTGSLVAILVSRIALYLVQKQEFAINTRTLHHWLVVTILISAANWGGLTAWVIYDESLSELRTIMLIITPVFAVAGASTLSISTRIRTYYPSLMFVPMTIVLLLQGGSENLVIASLSIFGLLYVFASSRTTHKDYWEAITSHMLAEERAELMEKLSNTDPLTQLKNRLFFDKELAREWKSNSRLNCPVSIIMMDLDHFKAINDNHGHLFGDKCLKAVATTFAQQLHRPTDCAARYGGEEFIALLPNTNEKAVQMIAKRMLEAMSKIELEDEEEQNVKLTCSIGGATVIPQYREDPSTLIKQADLALYHAKNTGRNRYVTNLTV